MSHLLSEYLKHDPHVLVGRMQKLTKYLQEYFDILRKKQEQDTCSGIVFSKREFEIFAVEKDLGLGAQLNLLSRHIVQHPPSSALLTAAPKLVSQCPS